MGIFKKKQEPQVYMAPTSDMVPMPEKPSTMQNIARNMQDMPNMIAGAISGGYQPQHIPQPPVQQLPVQQNPAMAIKQAIEDNTKRGISDEDIKAAFVDLNERLMNVETLLVKISAVKR